MDSAPLPTLVLSIDAGGVVSLNQEAVRLNELPERMLHVLATRAEKTVFVNGDSSLQYGAVAELIDIAKGAGASRVALLTERSMRER